MDSKPTISVADDPTSNKQTIIQNIFPSEQEILCIRFDQEDTMIAAGTEKGTVKLYHIHSNSLQSQEKVYTGKDVSPCTVIRWRPLEFVNQNKHVFVTGCTDGTVTHFQASNGSQISSFIEKDNQILALDFTHDGSSFITGGSDCKIRVYDQATQELKSELTGIGWSSSGHSNRIFSLKCLPGDSNIFLSGGWDTNLLVWDIREKKSVGTILGPKLSADAIDYRDGLILTGSYRTKQQLQLWDFKTLSIVKNIEWESGDQKDNSAFIFGCQFSQLNKENIIAVTSGLNQARIFDLSKQCQTICKITGFQKPINSVDYGNFSNKFALTSPDTGVVVFSITSL